MDVISLSQKKRSVGATGHAEARLLAALREGGRRSKQALRYAPRNGTIRGAERDASALSNPSNAPRRRKYLDPVQAAVFLGGLNSRTVTRWAREGYLPAYPMGEGKKRLWRFTEQDLERWMRSRRTGESPSDPEAEPDTLIPATDAPNKETRLEG